MCNFFSFVSDGHGTMYYFNAKARKKLSRHNPFRYDFDSHTSICRYFLLNEDRVNKYEYNPFTQSFVIDCINNKNNDAALCKKLVEEMDFSKILKSGHFTIRAVCGEEGILDKIVSKVDKVVLYFDDKSSVIFPKNIDEGYLLFPYYYPPISIDTLILPQRCHTLHLYDVKYKKEYKLPKHFKYIYFKDVLIEKFLFFNKYTCYER